MFAERNACELALLLKLAVPIVDIEEIGIRIVSNVELGIAIVVYIAEGYAQSARRKSAKPCLARRLGKRAIAVIAKENVFHTVIRSWTAVGQDAVDSARRMRLH